MGKITIYFCRRIFVPYSCLANMSAKVADQLSYESFNPGNCVEWVLQRAYGLGNPFTSQHAKHFPDFLVSQAL